MKCLNCGLMQSRQARCRRCGNPLESPRSVPRSSVKPVAGDNPYAPPEVSGHGAAMPDGASEIYRDGELIVARDGAPFPDRCVRCGQAANGFRLKKTFYWHTPSLYLLVLVSVLIYAIVALVVRKKASFELALCPLHHSRRRLAIGVGLALPLLGFAVMILTGAELASVWGFFLALLVGAVVGIIGAQILTPKRIEDGYAHLKGAHPRFLASLPALR